MGLLDGMAWENEFGIDVLADSKRKLEKIKLMKNKDGSLTYDVELEYGCMEIYDNETGDMVVQVEDADGDNDNAIIIGVKSFELYGGFSN